MNGRRNKNKKTTFWDFLIAFGSGCVNLLKIEKLICIIFLYLLGRDIYFTINIDKGEVYRENVISAADIIKVLIENDNYIDIIYIAIIAVLVVTIIILIFVINTIYLKEIHRLSRERSELMHDIRTGNFVALNKHNSSEKRGD